MSIDLSKSGDKRENTADNIITRGREREAARQSDSVWIYIFFVTLALWFFSVAVEETVEKFGHPLPDWTDFKIFLGLFNLYAIGVLTYVEFRKP